MAQSGNTGDTACSTARHRARLSNNQYLIKSIIFVSSDTNTNNTNTTATTTTTRKRRNNWNYYMMIK